MIGQPKVSLDLTVQAGVDVVGNTATHAATYAVPNHTYAEPEPVGDATAAALPAATVTSSDVTGTVTFNSVTLDITQLLNNGLVDVSAILAAVNSQVVGAAINPFIAQINEVLTPTAGAARPPGQRRRPVRRTAAELQHPVAAGLSRPAVRAAGSA